MAERRKAAQERVAALRARYDPYIQRIRDDEDLRANLLHAYESARGAVGRMSNGKSPSKALFDDKKLQKELKAAAESLRDAGAALREPRKRRRGGFGRLLLLAIVGAGVALALSEGLRKKVLDAIFGAEEEFEYTSTTAAPVTDAASEAAGTTT